MWLNLLAIYIDIIKFFQIDHHFTYQVRKVLLKEYKLCYLLNKDNRKIKVPPTLLYLTKPKFTNYKGTTHNILKLLIKEKDVFHNVPYIYTYLLSRN